PHPLHDLTASSRILSCAEHLVTLGRGAVEGGRGGRRGRRVNQHVGQDVLMGCRLPPPLRLCCSSASLLSSFPFPPLLRLISDSCFSLRPPVLCPAPLPEGFRFGRPA